MSSGTVTTLEYSCHHFETWTRCLNLDDVYFHPPPSAVKTVHQWCAHLKEMCYMEGCASMVIQRLHVNTEIFINPLGLTLRLTMWYKNTSSLKCLEAGLFYIQIYLIGSIFFPLHIYLLAVYFQENGINYSSLPWLSSHQITSLNSTPNNLIKVKFLICWAEFSFSWVFIQLHLDLSSQNHSWTLSWNLIYGLNFFLFHLMLP